METLVTVIHIVLALFLILVVLVQGGNKGGMGAAFGGGNTQGMFGATGATSFLGKLTYGVAFGFVCTSIVLAIVMGRGGNSSSLSDKLRETNPVKTDTLAPDPEADAKEAATGE